MNNVVKIRAYSFVFLMLTASTTVRALVGTAVPCRECTSNEIQFVDAPAGENITVYDGDGNKIGVAPVGAGGAPKIVIPPGTKGPITGKLSDGTDPPVELHPVIQPLLGTTAITTMSVESGSTVSYNGNNFILSGGFTAIDTDVVYDRASPAYGTLTGSIPATTFNLHGNGVAGNLEIRLTGDGSYNINLASAWNEFIPPPVTSVPFSLPFSGFVILNGASTSFNGFVTGLVYFGDGLNESVDLAIDIETSYGAITGKILASGVASCVPEPSSGIAITMGLLLLAFPRFRRMAR